MPKDKTRFCVFVMRLLAIFGIVAYSFFLSSAPVSAVAKQSSLSLSIQSSSIEASIAPLIDGSFSETNDATIFAGTDNFTGYNLYVTTTNGTDLIGQNGNKIESIDTAINPYAFSTNSSYNNKWGFKPSQYVSDSDVVISNYDFLPIPSGDGLLIAKSTSANGVSGSQILTDSFAISSGARVDNTLLSGSYTGTLVVSLLANSTVYNVTYDKNTDGAVNYMPTPNPQSTTITGGTPVEDSYVTLSDSIPMHNSKNFIGWCDEATVTEAGTGNETCPGTLYSAGDRMPVDQTAGPNITLYATWQISGFPIVWSQTGACEFHGATNGNITGPECEAYHDKKFIDTGVALYSQANYLKDFEVHFTLDSYEPSDQVDYFGSEDNAQQTFVNDKPESTAGDKKAPGFTVRRRNGTSIEFNSKFNNSQVYKAAHHRDVHEVSIYRLDNVIYYSMNDGPLTEIQDITGFNQFFELTTWFGAYPRDDCNGNDHVCTEAKRIPEATMSDMYVRLGKYSSEDFLHINFYMNDTTSNIATAYFIRNGNSLATLPSDPTYSRHVFDGWYTEPTGGTLVTASMVPSAPTDFYAHWLGTVELAVFEANTVNVAEGDTNTIRISNSDELEPYTFTSDDTNIATVDADTGVVTGVNVGTTTITVKGKKSNKTRTVTVEVDGQVHVVNFDSQGGSSVNNIQVRDGAAIGTLPISYLTGFRFEGWYTEPDGAGTKLTDTTVFDDETPTTYYAKWAEAIALCRAATVQHTETCTRSSQGCKAAGYTLNSTINYGTLIETPGTTPVAGDAFTCDINGDEEYDEDDERFYFYGIENGKAKLIYYKNIANVNESYADSIARLPTPNTPGWTNTELVPYSSGEYFGYVARFMSREDAIAACNNSTSSLGSNGKCLYLLEKSNFANTNLVDGWWLGSTNNSRVHTASLSITLNSGINAARPAIEVPMSLISY